MKIAICDDEKVFVDKLREKIEMAEKDCNISFFTDSVAFADSDELWDIVFLDIEMDGMNGFQIAELLSKRQPTCTLAFVTSHHELAVDGYDYQPFRYILKSLPEPVFERKIQETIQEYYRRNKAIKISYKGTHKKISISDIQWIEIDGHCLKIMLDGEVVLWYKSLGEMEQEFQKYGIIRCHRSFMVSLAQVKQLEQKRLILKNNVIIPIGRTYKAHVEEKYMKTIAYN